MAGWQSGYAAACKAVSGGFDPIHSGHIAYFKSARSHGDKLVVALNSDAWLENKNVNFSCLLMNENIDYNFKSIKHIKQVNTEDLMTVKGINVKIAELIKIELNK